MKKFFALLLAALFFVGCGQSQPKVPIASAYKFKGITYYHIQNHNPKKFVYQPPEAVEKKYNEQLLAALKEANLLDQNSTDELKITIKHHRGFTGEATPFPSDRIGGIDVAYQIQIIRGDQVLRHYTQDEFEFYDPGFFGNMKTIALQNTDDSYENDAIAAMVKRLMEIIKKF